MEDGDEEKIGEEWMGYCAMEELTAQDQGDSITS
jgi:hypothetical protein